MFAKTCQEPIAIHHCCWCTTCWWCSTNLHSII